jgi:hypothetical protein
MPFGELEVYVEGALGIKDTGIFGASFLSLSLSHSHTHTHTHIHTHISLIYFFSLPRPRVSTFCLSFLRTVSTLELPNVILSHGRY